MISLKRRANVSLAAGSEPTSRISLPVSSLCLLRLSLVLFSHTEKNSWMCSLIVRKEMKARTSFLLSDLQRLPPSMILLAAEKMWLLKMDLWKKRVIWNSPALPNVSTQQRCIHMEALGLSVQDNECKVIILDVEGSLSSQHANCWALRMIWSLREFLHQTLDH